MYLKDVAYALTTTLCPEELDNMDTYVDVYIDNLKVDLKSICIEKQGQKLSIRT